MTIEKAIETVLDLAKENALDPDDPCIKHEEGLRQEAERQQEAINTIEDFFVNVIFKGKLNETVTD